jgi:hypothetical protein
MSFKQYEAESPNKLRVEDDPPKSSLVYFDNPMISAKTPEKQRSKISKWIIVGGLALVTVILVVVLGTTENKQESRINPELVAAYETISAVAPVGYNVVLVGHDPLSIGDHEGLRANAPWALDLWYSTRPQAGGNAFTNETTEDLWKSWSPWSDDIINSIDPLYANIHSRSDLFLSNEPFYLKDEQYNSFSTEVQEAVDLWNNLNVRAYINEYYVATFNKNEPAPEGGKVLHKIGLVSDEDLFTFKSWGYGFEYTEDWPDGMKVYGRIDYCRGSYRKIDQSCSGGPGGWAWCTSEAKPKKFNGIACCACPGGYKWEANGGDNDLSWLGTCVKCTCADDGSWC